MTMDRDYVNKHIKKCKDIYNSGQIKAYDLHYSNVPNDLESIVGGFQGEDYNSTKYFYYQDMLNGQTILCRDSDGFHKFKLPVHGCNKISKITLYADLPDGRIELKTIENPPYNFSFFDYPIFFDRYYNFFISADYSTCRLEKQNIGIQRYMIADNNLRENILNNGYYTSDTI